MSGGRQHHFSTRMIHAGESPDAATGARGVPIHQSATFAFQSWDQIRQWEDGEISHFQYSREANPTVGTLERKIADLEGAEATIAMASGMAAISALFIHSASDEGHIVAGSQLYGSSGDLLDTDFPQLGHATTRVDLRDLSAVEAAMQPNTRLIMAETITNPSLLVSDIPALAEIAHRHGALLGVDNTFLSPALYRPLKDRADFVLHSATKYLSGTGQTIGGVISGRSEHINPLRERVIRLGSGMAPFTAWMIINGCKTLSFRVERHVENARAVAVQLLADPVVEIVNYPGLPGQPGASTLERLNGGLGGGLLSFRLKGDPKTTRAFINALQLCTIAVSLGEATTLIWPYREGLIRLAVGLEHQDDIMDDIARGLEAAHAVYSQEVR